MQAPPPSQRTRGKTDALYDLDVVIEAVVNAFAHRDYAISGAKIRLFLFADRLELHSPGKLPNTLTLDDMPCRTFTRNQLVVSFLSRTWSKRTGQVFLESRGEGVRKILQDGEAHSGRRPEYALFGEELRLTLWRKPLEANSDMAQPSKTARWRYSHRLLEQSPGNRTDLRTCPRLTEGTYIMGTDISADAALPLSLPSSHLPGPTGDYHA